MHFLKTSLTGPAKEAVSGMGFTAQAYYSAWELLTNRLGKPSVIVQAQLQKFIRIHLLRMMIQAAF